MGKKIGNLHHELLCVRCDLQVMADRLLDFDEEFGDTDIAGQFAKMSRRLSKVAGKVHEMELKAKAELDVWEGE